MIAALDILARLGSPHTGQWETIGAVLLMVVVMAYWVLKT